MNPYTVYRDIELPLVPVLAEMEARGVRIDDEHFKGLTIDATIDFYENLDHIHKLAGREINPNSSKQLSALLYDEMGEPVIYKTDKGSPSTDKEALKAMPHNEVAQGVLTFRETSTALSNFITKLPGLAVDGILHTSFNQAGHFGDDRESPATGRLSSSGPSLQQIPARGKWGKKIRQGFIAREGHIFIGGDISQEEYRLACLVAEEMNVLPYLNDPTFDPHQQTADDLTARGCRVTRDQAKNINYALVYGASPNKLLAMVPDLGGVWTARLVIDAFFSARPALQEWQKRAAREARAKGYSETLFGRRRYLPDFYHGSRKQQMRAERQAVNHIIQGTGADIIKMALVRVNEQLTHKARIVLTCHDDIVVECEDRVPEIGYVKNVLSGMVTGMVGVWLPVEVKSGPTWGDMS